MHVPGNLLGPFGGLGSLLTCLLFCSQFIFLTDASTVVEQYGGDGSFTFSLASSTNASNQDIHYYIPSSKKATPVVFKASVSNAGRCTDDVSLVPFTVFVTDCTVVTESVLKGLLTTYLDDDIYTEEFFDGIFDKVTALC